MPLICDDHRHNFSLGAGEDKLGATLCLHEHFYFLQSSSICSQDCMPALNSSASSRVQPLARPCTISDTIRMFSARTPWRWWRSRGCPLPRWPLRTPGWEFLDGCLAPAQGQSFCGPFAIVSRAWPAPTETSIVVGSGPRPRCQGGHARWWPPLTQDGAGAQGAAFCPRFVTITGTTFSWVAGEDKSEATLCLHEYFYFLQSSSICSQD